MKSWYLIFVVRLLTVTDWRLLLFPIVLGAFCLGFGFQAAKCGISCIEVMWLLWPVKNIPAANTVSLESHKLTGMKRGWFTWSYQSLAKAKQFIIRMRGSQGDFTLSEDFVFTVCMCWTWPESIDTPIQYIDLKTPTSEICVGVFTKHSKGFEQWLHMTSEI